MITRRKHAERWRKATLLGALVAMMASTAGAQAKPKPPIKGLPLSAWQAMNPDKSHRSVYVGSYTPFPMVVSTVTLQGCKNVREPCGDTALRTIIPPQGVVEVLQVHPADSTKGWSFEFSFEAGPVTRAEATNSWVGDDPVAPTAIPLEQVPMLAGGIDKDGRCFKVRLVPIPPGHRVLGVLFGKGLGTIRSVSAWFDSGGIAYRYLDDRRHPEISWYTIGLRTTSEWRITPPEPRVRIELDLARNVGRVTSTDSYGVETIVDFTGTNMLTAESLGRPGEVIAKLWKGCR